MHRRMRHVDFIWPVKGKVMAPFTEVAATRPDVVGVRMARDLEALQDRMPAFKRSEAVAAVELSLDQLAAAAASHGWTFNPATASAA